MLEAPEVEAHHHHKTGHSRLDMIFAALAIFLSCVSVFIAIHHGQTMERLVAASTWPNISFGTGNETDGIDQITLDLTNTGVGPARLETFEVFYKDKPVANLKELAIACCAGADQHVKGSFGTSSVRGNVLPARETIHFVSLRKDRNAPEIWAIANRERFNVSERICYCSVFDDCWVATSNSMKPTAVKECTPSQPVQYSDLP
jgi:hypothetical protein